MTRCVIILPSEEYQVASCVTEKFKLQIILHCVSTPIIAKNLCGSVRLSSIPGGVVTLVTPGKEEVSGSDSSSTVNIRHWIQSVQSGCVSWLKTFPLNVLIKIFSYKIFRDRIWLIIQLSHLIAILSKQTPFWYVLIFFFFFLRGIFECLWDFELQLESLAVFLDWNDG